MSVDVGFGSSITFDSGFFACFRTVSWRNISRVSIDTSCNSTSNGAMTFMPSDLENPGELEVELLLNPKEVPPYTTAAETCTLTFPVAAGNTTATTWAASAFLTNYEITNPYNDLMTARATLKFSGAITITAGS
jgi:hypothetical protein